jgi:prepilin peptidase CpaA
MPALGWSVAVAALIFGLLLPFAVMGMLGGGDLKLATAIAIGLPPLGSYQFVVATAVAGGLLALLYLAAHRLALRRAAPSRAAGRAASLLRRVLAAEAWRVRRRGPLPYGVAIAAGAALVLLGHHGV